MGRKTVPFARAHKATKCATCNGTGTVRSGKDEKTCPNCNGNGER